MSKHTPGPWEAMWTNDVGPDDEYYVEFYEILDAKGNRVGTAEEKHDAVLMAEAPRLLEALKGLHDDIMDYIRLNSLGAENNHWLVQARSAIAKATGEQA